MANPRSTAQIAGHPIHPMLIPFPIVCFIGVFLCDLMFWGTGNPGWVTATLWLLGAGLVMAALAAIAGFTDFFGDRQVRDLGIARWHAVGNVTVVVIEAINLYLRWASGPPAVVPTGLVLSLVAVALLGITGWLGGEMVFRRRVGVADTPDPLR